MLILITYDVDTKTESGSKRLRKVAKECVNYGHRVQNSVFECFVTEVQLLQLRRNLLSIINLEKDNVRFYHMGDNWHNKVESFGIDTSVDMNSELIV